jgi:transcriptional regulator with XRE-family HTH domain
MLHWPASGAFLLCARVHLLEAQEQQTVFLCKSKILLPCGSFCDIAVVPRRNPVPENEVEICERLRRFREHTGLSRAEMARRLGIDSARLSAHEHARVPVRYSVVRALMQHFRLSPVWLAGEKGWPFTETPFDDSKYVLPTDYAALFSRVFDCRLKEPLDCHELHLELEITNFIRKAKALRQSVADYPGVELTVETTLQLADELKWLNAWFKEHRAATKRFGGGKK